MEATKCGFLFLHSVPTDPDLEATFLFRTSLAQKGSRLPYPVYFMPATDLLICVHDPWAATF